jgi:hypothetical protein
MEVQREARGAGALLFQRECGGRLTRLVWASGAHGEALIGCWSRWTG